MAKIRGFKTSFDLKKLSKKMDDIVSWGLNEMAKQLNKDIQKGLDSSTDIDGNPFVKLSDSRLAQRGKKGTGGKPLVETGTMRKTRLIKASAKKPVAKVQMNGKRKGKFYGALHNKGYVVGGGRFKGSNVPQRKWFGMTKGMMAGGSENDKVMKRILAHIRKSWRKRLG
jgi:phage gpG-like protein